SKRLWLLIVCCLFLWANISQAQINRPYEPIVIVGDTLVEFLNYEIEYLYLYTYDDNEDNWTMVPFQIDEVNPAVDDSVKYFIPEDSLRGLFDADDELVFMAGDLGDKADASQWVNASDTIRYEIEFTDPIDGKMGYVYLYYSVPITDTIPNTYDMAYDDVNDRVHSVNYELGFIERDSDDPNTTGQLNDVIIKNGSGEDIFDRLKIRAIGSWWVFPIYFDEETIKASYGYAKQGPVRIIRNMVGHFIYELLNIDEIFTQTSFFYPWSGSFNLIDIPIGDVKEAGGEVDELRVSWDFNKNAKGVNFYSENNMNGFQIDGMIDVIDPTCFPDKLNWTMGTGDQGTMFNAFYIPPFGDNIGLYYHEATNGSVGDNSNLSSDTGDDSSFGDNGFFLYENIENYITNKTKFSIIYYNFFLPPHFDPNSASMLYKQLRTPLVLTTKTQKYMPPTKVAHNEYSVPLEFLLAQNYPNPFNSSTTISFKLPKRTHISLRVYDSLGRLVNILVDHPLPEGLHKYVWGGKDNAGKPVTTGIYFYKLSNENLNITKKLLLIK
ncbi:MAG: T9SS type A sorting domain-containing protein, partial [Candidatus Hodarchaeota archaeon]